MNPFQYNALVAATALVLTLSACGGDGPAPVQAAPTPTQTAVQTAPATTQTSVAPSKTVLVAAYGDSTMFGMTLVNGQYSQAPHNAPATLQTLLQQQFGPSVTVSNLGIPGSTAAQLLWGTGPVPRPWAQEMAQSTANVVIINSAINDAFEPDESDNDVTYIFGQLVQIATAAGKKVVIETANPIYNDHDARLWSITHDELAIVAQWSLPVVDQYDYMLGLPAWPSLLSDNIHPTDCGYVLKAQQEAAILGPIVQAVLTGR